MTTVQINAIPAPAAGLMVYNSTLNALVFYDCTAWKRTDGQHSIGENYGGGIVFYVDETGQHGLIAETTDQSTGIAWNNGVDTVTNAFGSQVYSGQINTQRIIATQGPGSYAASACENYQVPNSAIYGDWFLPSQNELASLYQQKTVVGGFANSYYWSSTENGYSTAVPYDFFIGLQGDGSQKHTMYHLRCIRAF